METFLLDLADPTRVSAFSHLLSSQLTPQGQDLITSVITRSKCDTPADEICSDEAVERSQNTILLVSTQAVYKAPHSTVRETQRQTQCQTHTHREVS